MLAELAVLIIILVMSAFQYLKGRLVNSFIMLMIAITAMVIAMSYFELAAGLILGYGFGGQWIYSICLLLIFGLVFAILNTAADRLITIDFYFKDLIDRIGRSVIGAVIGFIIAGVVIISVSMSPIPNKWSYSRFSADVPISPDKPNKTLILNADGLVAGLFSHISSSSMCSKTSFAVAHPDFINEIHLNHLDTSAEDKIFIVGKEAVKVRKAWALEEELVSDSNEPMPNLRGKAIVVRTNINGKTIKDGGALGKSGKVEFTMAQVKLVCKPKSESSNLRGKGKSIYPMGYLKSENENSVVVKKLSDVISVARSDFDGSQKQFDMVFYIPDSMAPVLLQFKQGSIAKVPALSILEKSTEEPKTESDTSESDT